MLRYYLSPCRAFFLVCALLALVTGVVAQESSSSAQVQNAVDVQQPAPERGDSFVLPVLFAAANAELPPMATGAESERANYVGASFALGATFDDNLLNTDPASNKGMSYFVSPTLEWQVTHPRDAWSLTYTPGFSRYDVGDRQNFMTHNLDTQFSRRMTRRWTVRARTQYSVSSNPFLVLGTEGSENGAPVGDNSRLVTPLAKQALFMADLATSYQLGKNDYLGLSGGWASSQFDALNGMSANLLDRNGATAQGFYAHRLSARNMVGVEYRFQQFRFSPVSSLTLSHRVLYFHAITFNPAWTLSFFIGPEQSVSSGTFSGLGTLRDYKDWNVSTGATLGWQRKTEYVRLTVARRVTDGGGLATSLQQNSAALDMRRLLTRHSALNIGARYDRGRVLVAAPGQKALSTIAGGIGFERNLSENLILHFGYERVHQDAEGLTGMTNHNRVVASLMYQFSRPIGR